MLHNAKYVKYLMSHNAKYVKYLKRNEVKSSDIRWL